MAGNGIALTATGFCRSLNDVRIGSVVLNHIKIHRDKIFNLMTKVSRHCKSLQNLKSRIDISPIKAPSAWGC